MSIVYLSFEVLRLHKITLGQNIIVNEVRTLNSSVPLTFGGQKKRIQQMIQKPGDN